MNDRLTQLRILHEHLQAADEIAASLGLHYEARTFPLRVCVFIAGRLRGEAELALVSPPPSAMHPPPTEPAPLMHLDDGEGIGDSVCLDRSDPNRRITSVRSEVTCACCLGTCQPQPVKADDDTRRLSDVENGNDAIRHARADTDQRCPANSDPTAHPTPDP